MHEPESLEDKDCKCPLENENGEMKVMNEVDGKISASFESATSQNNCGPESPVTSDRTFSPRLIRWTLRTNEFNIQILHRPGSTNNVADCLSRAAKTKNLCC